MGPCLVDGMDPLPQQLVHPCAFVFALIGLLGLRLVWPGPVCLNRRASTPTLPTIIQNPTPPQSHAPRCSAGKGWRKLASATALSRGFRRLSVSSRRDASRDVSLRLI